MTTIVNDRLSIIGKLHVHSVSDIISMPIIFCTTTIASTITGRAEIKFSDCRINAGKLIRLLSGSAAVRLVGERVDVNATYTQIAILLTMRTSQPLLLKNRAPKLNELFDHRALHIDIVGAVCCFNRVVQARCFLICDCIDQPAAVYVGCL